MALYCRARTIREIMTCGPTTVGSKLAVRALRDLFIAYGFSAFPVVDEADALLGIVTKVDLLRVIRHDRRRILSCAEVSQPSDPMIR